MVGAVDLRSLQPAVAVAVGAAGVVGVFFCCC